MESQSTHILSLFLGLGLIAGAYALLLALKGLFFVEVPEGHHVLILRFGQLVRQRKQSGLTFCPHFLPWIQVITVSLQRDFRQYSHVNINDSRGTSLKVTFWVELKVLDPVKAVFQVENWEES